MTFLVLQYCDAGQLYRLRIVKLEAGILGFDEPLIPISRLDFCTNLLGAFFQAAVMVELVRQMIYLSISIMAQIHPVSLLQRTVAFPSNELSFDSASSNLLIKRSNSSVSERAAGGRA